MLRAAAVGLTLATAAGGVAVAVRPPAALRPTDAASTLAGDSPLALPSARPVVSCPGPETAVVPDGSSPATSVRPLTIIVAAQVNAPGEDAGEVRVVERLSVRGPQQVAAPPDEEGARVAAVQTTLIRSGDRRGLTAAACRAAGTDLWLVGGATTPGRRSRLILVDPTPAPAVVDVVVLGPAGPVDVPAGRGLVIAPGRPRALQLDAVAPGLDRLAVHVVARRGKVAAVIDDSGLDGATPAGVDDVPVAAPPARHLTVPALVLPVPRARGSVAATVRLASPGAEDAVVHLRISGLDADAPLPGGRVVTVPARSVVDVPLTGLPPGAYAVVADADVPVVAAAFVRIAGPPVGPLGRSPADVAWTAAAGSVDGDVLVALPRPGAAQPSGGAELVLTAGAADADVVVRRVGDHGEALARSDVHVPAGRTAVVAVPDAAAAALTIGRGQRVTAGVATLTADAAGTMLTLMPVGSPPAPGPDRLAAVADPWLPAQSSQSSSVP